MAEVSEWARMRGTSLEFTEDATLTVLQSKPPESLQDLAMLAEHLHKKAVRLEREAISARAELAAVKRRFIDVQTQKRWEAAEAREIVLAKQLLFHHGYHVEKMERS